MSGAEGNEPAEKRFKTDDTENAGQKMEEGAGAQSTVKLVSSDGDVFELPKKAAILSRMVKRLLEDLGVGIDDCYSEAIPLPRLESKTVKLVVEWCLHHIDDPPVVEIDNREKNSEDIPPWDKEFFGRMETSTVFEVITAANFLDIYMLMDSGCKTIANMIKGSNTAELRKKFDIVNDFTPEEEERLRKEHTWIEDNNVAF